MPNTADRLTPSDPSLPWIVTLRHYRKQAAYALLALALLLALIPLLTLLKYRWDYAAVTLWGGLLALISLGAGLYLLWSEPGGEGEADNLRLFVLAVGGLSGFATWVLSLALAWRWSATVFGGLEAWQGPTWWHLWVCILALFGGMALMFLSLLPARAVEHSDPALRRLLYGYNAVLSGLLLLAILGVINVLLYNYSSAAFDWTASGIYTLSDQSKNILRGLEKPAKVTVILPDRDEVKDDVSNLIDNARAINPKLQAEFLSPDLDEAKVDGLAKRYQFIYRDGLLVVYGTEPEVEHLFIRRDELVEEAGGMMRRGGQSRTFKGEDALMSALNTLSEGKTRAVVYFTQGSGELDITDSDVSQVDQGAGALRERLQKATYEVKGLQFSDLPGAKVKNPLMVVSAKVPDDAAMVVVAGPRNPLPEAAVKALGDYMNPAGAGAKKGKLVVLLEPALDPNGNLVRTGLEGFLAKWNVQVGNNRILRVPTFRDLAQDPLRVRAMVNPGLRQNPIVQAFVRYQLPFYGVRTVEPIRSPARPEASPLNADTLMVVLGLDAWAESNVRGDPSQIVNDLIQQERIREKLGDDVLPIAVAVSEPTAPSDPADPHAFMRQQDQKPRLIVFGDATFASNRYMAEGGGSFHFPLFSSTLAWLRERPSNIGLPPKTRNTYTLSVGTDVIGRLRWLPTVLLFVGILGLGMGVWVVRRR